MRSIPERPEGGAVIDMISKSGMMRDGHRGLPDNVINLCWRGALLTAAQMKAARALVGMEQKALAEASGVSLPTIQRMEASNGTVRGVIESLGWFYGTYMAAPVSWQSNGSRFLTRQQRDRADPSIVELARADLFTKCRGSKCCSPRLQG